MKNVEDVYALSPLQQGMLFHTLYSPRSGLYVEQMDFTLRGELDVDAFEGAWRWLAERHPVLRTAFVWKELKTSVQVVRKKVKLPWRQEDWSALAPEALAQRLDDFRREERETGFELEKAPLFRAALLRTGERSHHFVLTVHHLLIDGWSSPILFRELFTAYEVLRQGGQPHLEPPRPYRHYVAWLQQQDMFAAETFWRGKLRGLAGPTRLGLAPVANAGGAERWQDLEGRLPAETAAALQAMARRRRLTSSTLVQGAWAVLLSRYSGGSDVVFGTTVAGRPAELPGVESMIGLFINTLPVRPAVPATGRLAPWLAELQDEQLARERYAYTPLFEIQAWSGVARGEPLFDSLVVFENYPVSRSGGGELPGLEVEDFRMVERTNYPLTLVAAAPGDHLVLRLTYETEAVGHAAARRIMGHLQALLAGMAEDPDLRLCELPSLSGAEAHQLLAEWSGSTQAPDAAVHQLFEARAEQVPDAVAVVADAAAVHFTYRELDLRANHLACVLARHGAGPETVVGLCVERSAELIVAMLGILKVGAAYLPLDPGDPAERLGQTLADARTPLILAAESCRGALPDPLPESRIVTLETTPRRETARPAAAGGAHRLAYVMYTSGSTGRPKGVAVHHEGIVRLVRWASEAGLGRGDVFLQLAPHSFDAATLEIWAPLTRGARLAIAPPGALSLEEVGALVERQRVSSLWLTAGLFHPMVEGHLERLVTLRRLLAGGDVLSPEHVRAALAGLPGCCLINGYGPTENTTFTCCHFMASPSESGPREKIIIPFAVEVAARGGKGRPGNPRAKPAPMDGLPESVAEASPTLAGVAGPSLDLGRRVDTLPSDRSDSSHVGRPQAEVIPGPSRAPRVGEASGTGRDTPSTASGFVSGVPGLPLPPLPALPGGKRDDLFFPRPIGTSVPIGRPITGTRILVLDHHGRPCPVGAAGELCTGGAGLARGYFRSAAATAEKFVPDPVPTRPGQRLYRTGDRARFHPDGTVDFLGRLDRQVKLRGFRVEPAEVEAFLGRLPGVGEAVAVVRERASGDPRLVAYYVATADTERPEAGDLRRRLERQLPTYMVPSAFVELDELPLLPSGKVDRGALPAPEGPATEGAGAEITDPTQEMVAGIFATVLGLGEIGPDADFFELGGHSLLATRAVSQVRKTFAVELPLRRFFDAPTVAELAAVIEESRREGGMARPPIEPVPRELDLPLSFAQQRLWFLDRLDSESTAYLVPHALHLAGTLDIAALGACLSEILRRHEALRTTFPTVDGEAVQRVNPTVAVPLPVIDLAGLDEDARRNEARCWASEEQRRPLSLTGDLMLRTALMRLGGDEHVLLVTIHHIAADDWSIGVFNSELSALYDACTRGEPSPLPELAVQYADFACWQRRWLSGEVLEAQLAYWKRQVAGMTPLALPTDRSHPAVRSYRGGYRLSSIDTELTRRLRALARSTGATLYMVLLAALKTVYSRCGGQSDLALGSPIANRNHSETEPMIGYFANILVLRTDLAGDPAFEKLLSQVRRNTLDAYTHQDLPFERLVEEVAPQRDLSHNPLVQSTFGFHNAPKASLELTDLTLSTMEADTAMVRFDLEWHVWETGDRLSFANVYDTDLFDATTIGRLHLHFKQLLASAAETTRSKPISQLAMLPDAEEHQLRVEWSAPAPWSRSGLGLDELFDATARRLPDAIALTGEGSWLTYHELGCRSGELAARLRALGVGPEVLVGFCVERSIEMVVCILGILEAGGAYLPLDPNYPQERLELMLDDAAAPVLLVQESCREAVGNPSPWLGTRVMSLDDDSEWPEVEQAHASSASAEPDPEAAPRLAYVMYTSASTGQPKGVAVDHAAVVRLVQQASFAELDERQVFLQLAPFSFDAATLEIWGPLTNGGCLVIPPARPLSLEEIGGLVERHRVSTLWLTAGLFHPMVEDHLESLRPLRQLLAGGDVLSVPHVHKALAGLPGCRVINGYGPTENTTFTCCHAASERMGSTVPVGRPISGTRVFLVGRRGEGVPIGVAGQLVAGGDGLAREYLGRAALTAERFTPDSLSGEEDARLYQTGDMARFLGDGTIEFLGRIDRQVKVRGFRIEPGEVEAALAADPEVAEVVAVVRETPINDPEGGRQLDKRLVAYVVPAFPDPLATPEGPADALQDEQISEWEQIFQETYAKAGGDHDPTFDISGWNDSYTGLAIAKEEMREWVDATVGRILALGPRRVLEIGVGSGLLLSQVAPHAEKYWASDFSQEVLGKIEHLKNTVEGLGHVRHFHRTAEDFSDFEPESFDVVVLNSIVQYFPSADYLFRVLEGALRVVAPGGAVFVGDVRNLALLETFHASVEHHRASSNLVLDELRRRVRQSMADDEELLIDPTFFAILPERFRRVTDVRIQPRRGRRHNELTRFRYDAVLAVGGETPPQRKIEWIDWNERKPSAEEARRQLSDIGPEVLAWRGVENARVEESVEVLDALGSSGTEVAGLRDQLSRRRMRGVDPEDLWELGDELAYDVHVSWAGGDPEGRYDVVLLRRPATLAHVSAFGQATRRKSWAHYTNHPLLKKTSRHLARKLRHSLEETLPAYMMPSAFVVLGAFPLTPNGKVDRGALPEPLAQQRDAKASIPPRDEIELQLVRIWEEVLDVSPIGVREDFFELGGHSLLAVRLVSRVRETFAQNLPLAILFQSPTVEQLADVLRRERDALPWSPLVAVRSGAKRPYFCIPGAGGNVVYFHELARCMDPERPFYALQAAGLDGRSEPFATVEEMATAFLAAMKNLQPEGPYLVGGHSFGGKVAYEILRQLRAEGQDLAHLSILDTNAPGFLLESYPAVAEWAGAKWLYEISRVFERLSGASLDISYSTLESLPAEEQLRYFMDQLKHHDFISSNVDVSPIRGMLNVYITNCNIYMDNEPEVMAVPCPVTLFRAEVFHDVFLGDAVPAEIVRDPSLGWNDLTYGKVEIHYVPGDHVTMMAPPNVQVLAERLSASLDQAETRWPHGKEPEFLMENVT